MYEIVGGVTVVTFPGNIIKEPPGTLKKPEIHVPVAHFAILEYHMDTKSIAFNKTSGVSILGYALRLIH